MDTFIEETNELSRNIQSKSAQLFLLLTKIEVDKLDIPNYCLVYFKKSHLNRLFFSIQTSAHLLYRAILEKRKPVQEIILLDYGAGVGTLYLLAKMIGCRMVVYNDHMDDWKNSAATIARMINVHIDQYVVGDIAQTLDHLNKNQIQCDMIISRNVVEHIYDLARFFDATYNDQPHALHYHSTTANIYNIASHLKHVLWHKKWESIYSVKRMDLIEKEIGRGEQSQLLTRKTRGLAGEDLKNAIEVGKATRIYPDPSIHYTNTCDPVTGVWAEHLLSAKQYRKMINHKQYDLKFAPGFWDTHYKNGIVNGITGILNYVIRLLGKGGMYISPFIYIIAKPLHPK